MERISAFIDGEANQSETHHAMLRLKQDSECTETFDTFHLIGDVMRGAPVLLQDDFMARFHARMEQEPTQLAPRVWLKKPTRLVLSAAASLSAIGLVLILTVVDNPYRMTGVAKVETPAETQVASSERPATAANQGKFNEYLMAHQEYSPSNALQGVAPYVRTVSETHDGNNR
ncbi:MAG: Anti sigma-E protein RseA family protein [Betaproteobacteria bacterium]|jgi:sigma-E factor negative regulatory protein RseA|nr:Anti sigma-E protein RseA family protein [Betaproteobacteria bacterium]